MYEYFLYPQISLSLNFTRNLEKNMLFYEAFYKVYYIINFFTFLLYNFYAKIPPGLITGLL